VLTALLGSLQRESPLHTHFAASRLYDRRLWVTVARFGPAR
jgi:hypothetical protein